MRYLACLFFPLFANAHCIILDPGHGGADQSAYNKTYHAKEGAINLLIAKELSKKLLGHKVFLTRSTDTTLSIPERVNIGVDLQKQFNNECFFISIHHNMYPQAQGTEAFFKEHTLSKNLAHRFVRDFSILLTLPNRGAKTSQNLPDGSKTKALLENIPGTVVLLELFFMDKDQEFQKHYTINPESNTWMIRSESKIIDHIILALGL